VAMGAGRVNAGMVDRHFASEPMGRTKDRPLERQWAEATPLLTVRGRILSGMPQGRSGLRRCLCTDAELRALASKRIVTSTIWTPRCSFEGPLLTSVLEHVRARGQHLRLDALDDYQVTIPWEDLDRYGLILAHSADDQRLRRSHFGPLWLIYPRDEYPNELNGPVAQAKFIWQVRSLEVL
jgi:hypothetical protein